MSETSVSTMKLLAPPVQSSRANNTSARLQRQKTSGSMFKRLNSQVSVISENDGEEPFKKTLTPLELKKIMVDKLNQSRLNFPPTLCSTSRENSVIFKSVKKSQMHNPPRILCNQRTKSLPMTSLMLTRTLNTNKQSNQQQSNEMSTDRDKLVDRFAEFMDNDFGYQAYKPSNIKRKAEERKAKGLRRGSSFEKSRQSEDKPEIPKFDPTPKVKQLVRKASNIFRRRGMQSPVDDDTKQQILNFNILKENDLRYKHFKSFEKMGIKEDPAISQPFEKRVLHEEFIPLPANMNRLMKQSLHQNKSNADLYSKYCEKRQSELRGFLTERQVQSKHEIDHLNPLIKIREPTAKDQMSKDEHLLRMNLIRVARETLAKKNKSTVRSNMLHRTRSTWLETAKKAQMRSDHTETSVANLNADGSGAIRRLVSLSPRDKNDSPKIDRW